MVFIPGDFLCEILIFKGSLRYFLGFFGGRAKPEGTTELCYPYSRRSLTSRRRYPARDHHEWFHCVRMLLMQSRPELHRDGGTSKAQLRIAAGYTCLPRLPLKSLCIAAF